MAQILSLPPLPAGEKLRDECLTNWEQILDAEEELIDALMRILEAKRQVIREMREQYVS